MIETRWENLLKSFKLLRKYQFKLIDKSKPKGPIINVFFKKVY